MSKVILYIYLILFPLSVEAKEFLKGIVSDTKKQPLQGASVFWEGTSIGVSTNEHGLFSIPLPADSIKYPKLSISFLGYEPQSINVLHTSENLSIILTENTLLNEVVVSQPALSTISSRFSTLQTQKITKDELFRAACCNLSESFETNPSVDVAYSDAATGAKQIKLLGLSGTYVQMLTENFPNFRGVASSYGLDYVPGPWIESILISKGTSSVKNGYEAITGQINVEYKKPLPTTDILSANLFAGDNGRYEANLDVTSLLNEHLGTTSFAHFSSEEKEFDMNHDGFLDTPLKRQFNFMNRWDFRKNKYIAQFGFKLLNEDRKGGQISKVTAPSDSVYKIGLKTNRIEFFSKNGLVLNHIKNESFALIVSGSYHEQKSNYGFSPYNVYETNIYSSFMYEKDFSDMHRLSTGLSLNYDYFNQNYILALPVTPTSLKSATQSDEIVTGAYAEYTFNKNNKLIVLAGIRADYSNLYDLFVTPRIHLKYNITDWMNLRGSIGKGYRTAHILPENNFYMAGSRKINIANNSDQEEAWNYGANISFYIPVAGKDLTILTEYYYTNFRKQVIADMDSDPHAVSFYNLKGKSYSSVFQIEITYPLFRGFTITSAYRISDVKVTYNDILKEKPLTNKSKGLVTLSYQTPLRKWQFDVTSQFNGGGRLPDPDKLNPLWESKFKSFTMLNAQVTKFFRTWSAYLGAENLLDFTQSNPIIDPQNPWGDNFDTTMIWGPVHGRKFYVGLRYNIPRL